MSLSADERKHYWKGQKDSLNRIRSRLSDRDTPPHHRDTPPHRRSSPKATVKRSHSPYGKYRKPSSPAYLPGLDRQSPDYRGQRELRRRGYDVVPSVRHRGKNRSPSVDYDSWGEESDDDDRDVDDYQRPQFYVPPQYVDPRMGYPAYGIPGQPPVVYGPPFPVFYPPPPPQYRNRRRRDRRQKSPDRLVLSESQPPKGRTDKGHVHYSLPDRTDRYQNSPVKEDVLKRYKYIHPRDSPFSPPRPSLVEQRFGGDIDSLMYFHFTDHPIFAENLVGWLVNDLLDEIIPDLLIDTITDFSKMSPGHPLYYPSQDTAEELLGGVIDDMLDEAARAAVADLVNEYMGKKKGTDMDWLQQIENEKAANEIFEDLLTEHLQSERPKLVEDAFQDIVIDDIIDEDIIDQEIDDEILELAQEVLNRYDTKITHKELKSVSKVANDKLVDSFMEHYLLTILARQGMVWGENDHANKIMDGLILNVLIEQYYGVRDDRDKTITNGPVRKLHEKVVTDVALDLLLQQLSITLDEDLLDVDEYERGVDGYTSQPVTPTLPISRVYSSIQDAPEKYIMGMGPTPSFTSHLDSVISPLNFQSHALFKFTGMSEYWKCYQSKDDECQRLFKFHFHHDIPSEPVYCDGAV